RRGARDVARIALRLADPHVLVGPALGRALPGVRGADARRRALDRMAAADDRRVLVHLPDREGLAPDGRSPAAQRVSGMASARRARARRPGHTPVERLRGVCMALPQATAKIGWGETTWRVRGKLFAQLDNHHHGADHLAVWLPAPLGEQEAMILTDPVRFFRPPYVGPRVWVGVRIDRRPDWTQLARLVEQAYLHVAPPRLLESLGTA